MLERNGENRNAICEMMLGRFLNAPPLVLAFLVIAPVGFVLVVKAWLTSLYHLENVIPSARAIPLVLGIYVIILSLVLTKKPINAWSIKTLIPLIILSVILALSTGFWERAYLQKKGYVVSTQDKNPIKSLLLPKFRKLKSKESAWTLRKKAAEKEQLV